MNGIRPDSIRIPPQLARISDYVDWYAARQPGVEAMVLGQERYDYARLQARVDSIARALIAAGIGHGDRVATLSTPHPDFWAIFLATASIGAIWVGLNPRYQLDEYRYIIGDSGPVLLFARTRIDEREFAGDLRALMAECSSLRRLVTLDEGLPVPAAETMQQFLQHGSTVSRMTLDACRAGVVETDPALIVYTSGTTGRPKGALLPHCGLTQCSRVQMRYWRADPVRVVNFLPINHIGCVGDLSAWCLVAGGCIVFMEKFDAAGSIELTVSERCTVWGGVPTTILMTLSLPEFEHHDLSELQLIIWSGAAAPEELVRRLGRIVPRLSNSYGATETIGSVTFVEPTDDVGLLANSVGHPVPDYEFRLTDRDGRVVSVGEAGEICVRGKFIMRGYWQRPRETAETIDADGWLHTGDLAVERPDGAIRLVGRLKEMFKSGGYNIYPREIEQVLEGCPGVAMAAVVPVPDPVFGEVGHAYVLREPGATLDVDTLLATCRAQLANYKVPKRLVIEDELPLLPIGKLDKVRLREAARDALSSGPGTAAQ